MIRWKRSNDLSSIVKLVRNELIPLSPWQHPSDSRLHGQIDRRLRRGSTLVVARNRFSAPIAFLHMIVQDKTLFIDMLAVDRVHQNRHWGSELMQRAEEYGAGHECTIAKLYVDEGNDRGRRFYERLGYQTVSHLPALRCYEMAKPLGVNVFDWA